MKQTSIQNTDPRPQRASVLWFGAFALFGASACGGGGGTGGVPGPPQVPQTVVANPNAGIDDSKRFIVDPHEGGFSQDVRLSGIFWGRLVDVHAITASGGRDPVPQQRNFLIGSNVISDGQDYLLEVNPVTSKTLLTILRLPSDPQFVDLLVQAEQNLPPIFDQPVGGAGIFSMVPRNATIVLRFDDLLEPSTITADTIQVLTGDPAITPYNARILPDTNHGGLAIFAGDAGPTFYPTRVLIDTTVSELESFETDPPLQPNGVGFPSSSSVTLANVILRVPTQIAPNIGQTTILLNPTAHAITTTANGSIDFGTSSVDVVRAMRSGGNGLVTGDSFNGFLEDVDAPSVVGTQPVVINSAPVPNDPEDEASFLLPSVQFLSVFCAQTPEAGDIIQQAGFFAEIVLPPVPVQNGILSNVSVRLLLGNPADWPVSGVGAAEFVATFNPADDTGKETCFVRVTPTPAGFPLAPNEGIATNSEIGVRFTEPMDPTSMTAFDSLTLTRVSVPLITSDYIVGRVDQSQDLQQFTFVPDLPLKHQGPPTPLEESYFLTLSTGALGPSDLAGNGLAFSLPQIEVKIDPNAATRENGGRVTRFTSPDEEAPIGDEMTGPLPEWTGQHLYDLVRELIRPRPVIRYEAVADRTQAVPSLMLAFPQGVQTPLSNLGSRMQTVWRYADVGFGLQDITNFNVDVEGMNWAPVGNQIVADHYTNFEISLSHSKYQPDEYIDPSSLFPKFPNSGLKNSYANNVLDGPQQIVHPRELGYTVSPGDFYVSGTGTGLMPYPLNQTIPVSQYRTFTWRDTSKLMRGGTPAPLGSGVEIFQNLIILGIDPMNFMTAGNIETIGLPLLMDFKCFPDGDALGLNALDISLGTNSSARPNFRAFTTGGTNTGQIPISVQPDLTSVATGGYNPGSTPIAGQSTYGLDNTFYIGALDLVVRVSRSYSVWFGTQDSEILTPAYNPAVKEPRDVDQPQGTSVNLAYRGAINIVSPDINQVVTTNAMALDGYGDYYQPLPPAPTLHNNPNPTFNFLNDSAWHDDVSDIDGVPYYQIRITFLSNIETALSPELSALGITWQVQN